MATPGLDVALRVAADLDQAVKEVSTLNTELDQTKAAAQNAGQGLNTAAAAATKSTTALKAEATAIEASNARRGRLIALLNTERGARILEAQAVNRTAQAQRGLALTAGELRNAQRQLPAQITDIVTGLASGQSVFMVAIQQGGQLKDTWGGLGPAARAVAGAISPMAIAVTAGAAAFALIGVAAYQGYEEIRGYDSAVISTGYSAGVTSGQIADMADQVGDASGQFGNAEKAAQQLAASGKVSADAMEDAINAAVNLATLTGDSIESTTDKIIELAASPTEMLVKLNEQYGFLTSEVYEHVRSLEEQGRTQDAVRAAVEEFARVHEQRVQEAEARAGTLESAWRGVGNIIRNTWNDLKNLGRDDAEYQLAAARRALGDAQSRASARGLPFDASRYEAAVRAAEKLVATEQTAARVRAGFQATEDFMVKGGEERRKAREEAEKDWERQAEASLSKRQRLESDIAEIRKNGLLLKKSEKEIDAQIEQARARYAESLPKGRKAGKAAKTDSERADEAAQRELDNMTKQIALLGQLEEGERKVSQEARIRVEIEQGAHRNASESLQKQLLDKARLLDAAEAEREAEEKKRREYEKTERAYEQLSDTLRTPAEAAVEEAIEQVELLNEALEKGIINKQQLDERMGRVAGRLTEESPKFNGIAPEVGGVGSELGRFFEAAKEEADWYKDSLARLAKFRAEKAENVAAANAEEALVKAQHEANLQQLEVARQQLTLSAASDFFGQLSTLQRSENSKIATIGKAAAIAQAMINTYQSATAAYASLSSIPYVGPALGAAAAAAAIAAGLANVAQIRAQPTAYATGGLHEGSGHVRGPGSGTSDSINARLSDYEFVTRAAVVKQPGALNFLEDFNARGMGAVRDWRGYAEGGLFTERAQPRTRMGAGGGSATSVHNRMRVYLYQDQEQLVEALLNHPRTEKKIVATAAENGQAIRADWS